MTRHELIIIIQERNPLGINHIERPLSRRWGTLPSVVDGYRQTGSRMCLSEN